jgi:subtilisin family serine protease
LFGTLLTSLYKVEVREMKTRNKKIVKMTVAVAGILLSFALKAYAFEAVKVAILDSGSNIAYKEGISLVDGSLRDNNGHGTLIAQIIKESCPNAEFYIIKVIGKDGLVINEDAVILGLEWAIAKDAKVINMSLRMKPSQRLHDVIKKAYAKGIILVAAAGNNDKFSNAYYSTLEAKSTAKSSAQNSEVAYPAKYPEVIAVGALNQYGKVYNQSAQSGEVDLYARGYYGNRAGTSMLEPLPR